MNLIPRAFRTGERLVDAASILVAFAALTAGLGILFADLDSVPNMSFEEKAGVKIWGAAATSVGLGILVSKIIR